MHPVKVLEELEFRMRNDERPDLKGILSDLNQKLYHAITDYDAVYGHLAELKNLGNAALSLHRESQGEAGYHTPEWPKDLRKWRDESLLPFLESLSNRLPSLSEDFHVLLFKEWQLEPDEPRELTPEQIAKKKHEDFNYARYLVEQLSGDHPDIKGQLESLIEKIKPEEPSVEGIEAQAEATAETNREQQVPENGGGAS